MPETADHVPAKGDFLPLNGTDYVEFYVGNARQSSHYYRSAFGSAGGLSRPGDGHARPGILPAGQDKIRLVLTTPL